MADKNGVKNGSKWTDLLMPAVIAAIGASGGIYITLGTPLGQDLTRPDPFTGTQATALEYRLNSIEGKLDFHMGNHPDDVNKFDRRITRLEAQNEQIILNQERILNRLGER